MLESLTKLLESDKARGVVTLAGFAVNVFILIAIFRQRS